MNFVLILESGQNKYIIKEKLACRCLHLHIFSLAYLLGKNCASNWLSLLSSFPFGKARLRLSLSYFPSHAPCNPTWRMRNVFVPFAAAIFLYFQLWAKLFTVKI